MQQQASNFSNTTPYTHAAATCITFSNITTCTRCSNGHQILATPNTHCSKRHQISATPHAYVAATGIIFQASHMLQPHTASHMLQPHHTHTGSTSATPHAPRLQQQASDFSNTTPTLQQQISATSNIQVALQQHHTSRLQQQASDFSNTVHTHYSNRHQTSATLNTCCCSNTPRGIKRKKAEFEISDCGES